VGLELRLAQPYSLPHIAAPENLGDERQKWCGKGHSRLECVAPLDIGAPNSRIRREPPLAARAGCDEAQGASEVTNHVAEVSGVIVRGEEFLSRTAIRQANSTGLTWSVPIPRLISRSCYSGKRAVAGEDCGQVYRNNIPKDIYLLSVDLACTVAEKRSMRFLLIVTPN
jgi:hypothetical protein